jgi:hypothetical protein
LQHFLLWFAGAEAEVHIPLRTGVFLVSLTLDLFVSNSKSQ